MHRLIPDLPVIGQREVTRGARGRLRMAVRAAAAGAAALLAAGCGAQQHATAGLPAATASLPKLSAAQLAGQRVIYSYSGTTPPARLLTLISRGEAAGVI